MNFDALCVCLITLNVRKMLISKLKIQIKIGVVYTGIYDEYYLYIVLIQNENTKDPSKCHNTSSVERLSIQHSTLRIVVTMCSVSVHFSNEMYSFSQ